MTILSWLIFFVALTIVCFLTLALSYLFFLAISWWLAKKSAGWDTGPQKRIAVLIPAHNEEQVIGTCLENIRGLDYPGNLFQTVVIADNCSDRTAQLARQHGTQVLERVEAERKGKGFTLSWALERIDLKDFDAILFLDADCVAEKNLLSALNHRLCQGQVVLQASVGIHNFRQSLFSYLLYLGNLVENCLFHGGRAARGLPSFLRGTGMCLSIEVLKEYGWQHFSQAEDLEFSLSLLKDNLKVSFLPETKVLAIQPTVFRTARSQKRRWAAGTFQILRKNVLQLVKLGFKSGRWELFEMKQLSV
jgi:cellulose synthase/poly-beta-1,6-N-acetylglucosamine synthase-like glycosyltransferase